MGEFSSENYPSSYDNSMSCSWTITVDSKKVGNLRGLETEKESK
ncbi:ovochymase-2, partial [Tachysurus ichikawai]